MREGLLAGEGRALLRVMLALAMTGVVAVAAGCGSKGKGSADVPVVKSPYLPMPAEGAAQGKDPQGPAAKAADPAAAAPQAPAQEEAPKSRVHPAAAGKEYKFLKADDIAPGGEDRELLDLMSNAKTGEKAFKRIKAAGKDKYEMVRKALRCTNREVRMQAALILGILKDSSKETYTAITDAVLLDPDPDVRALAAKCFISIHSPEAAQTLILSLKQDPYEAARANAAWALGDVGNMIAVGPLREALKDNDTFVRLRAVSALKKLKAKAAVPDLIDRLADTSPMVRERARDTLKDITGRDMGDDPAKWRK